jgi:ribosomal protein S18 acetylase RimI-like enzyme
MKTLKSDDKKLSIKSGDTESALKIMREAASWLIKKGEPMWELKDLTAEKILDGITANEVYVGYIENKPVTAMILQWHDKIFWPDIPKNKSGFIHKLCVSREFAGKGYAKAMLQFAENECKKREIHFLRLDCAGNREKLCKIYEDNSFKQIGRKMVGSYDTAFYVKEII